METKKDIKSMCLAELEEELKAGGHKAFRAGQIFQWIHEKLADSFEEMSNLSKDLRRQLEGVRFGGAGAVWRRASVSRPLEPPCV